MYSHSSHLRNRAGARVSLSGVSGQWPAADAADATSASAADWRVRATAGPALRTTSRSRGGSAVSADRLLGHQSGRWHRLTSGRTSRSFFVGGYGEIRDPSLDHSGFGCEYRAILRLMACMCLASGEVENGMPWHKVSGRGLC